MGGTAAIIAENAQLRAARHKHSVSVVTLDVDYFRAFIDNHGHDAGDTVLRHVGEILQSPFTDDAVRCRFGGEEFVVLPRRTLDWRRNRCGMRQGSRPGCGGRSARCWRMPLRPPRRVAGEKARRRENLHVR